jgi:tetratricopeptide (TPR) repeat protein
MKLFLVLYFSMICFLSPAAQDISALLSEADRTELLPDEEGAFQKFKEVLKISPTNLHALTRCSELCSRIGKRQPDNKMRDSYYDAARIYAQTALKIDPLNSEANCAMAMALGRTTMSKSGKEKIYTVKEIRKYLDVALQSDPNNFLAWHILGRWHYEISGLNFFERSAVRIFYGGFPESSIKEAIDAFEKSKSIVSGFILNYLELAKAYHRNDQDDKAVFTIRQMLLLPVHTDDDLTTKELGKKMLKDWE